MPRPAVDVVVPFKGTRQSLDELRTRLAQLRLGPGDTLLIVDNTPLRPDEASPAVRDEGSLAVPGAAAEAVPGAAAEAAPGGLPPVLRATERRTPGHARNKGAARGGAEWLVFFDADTDPAPDLLDRYFEPEPDRQTAMLGGGVRDEPVPLHGPPAARFAYIRRAMSQDDTLRFGTWGFPKSANVAIRRSAFEALGGFREDIRAAEDADLNYRLRRAGWRIERRETAIVVHRSRQTVQGFVVQKLLHGAGGAWLDRHYPGSFPARRRLGLTWWAARTAARRLLSAARTRDRDTLLWALLDPVEALSWELGRSLPNERPLTSAVWWRAMRRLRGGGSSAAPGGAMPSGEAAAPGAATPPREASAGGEAAAPGGAPPPPATT